MVVADKKQSLTITGNGDVLEPNDGIIGEPQSCYACVYSNLHIYGSSQLSF